MNIEQRQAIERKIVRHLIRTAKKHGFKLVKIDDGEEFIKCDTESKAMDAVFSVDESTIFFKRPSQPKCHYAFLVLGNDGWDVIADASVGTLWDDVMDEMDDYADKFDV